MTEKQRFPPQLLQSSNDSRKEYFKNKVVNHKILENVTSKTINVLDPYNPYMVIAVVGPTGVGKSTFCKGICSHFIKKTRVGKVPFVLINADSNTKETYDWFCHLKDGLEFLNEPMIEEKIDIDKIFSGQKKDLRFTKSTFRDLKKSFISALIHREPYFCGVDEAQQMVKGNAKTLEHYMDFIKHLANTTNIKQLLVGTYQLNNMKDLNGQLGRRIHYIHFDRYHFSDNSEYQEFRKIMINLERHMPVEIKPQLSSELEYIYERTLGLVGVLKDWLTRSLILAIDQSDRTVTIEHLKKTVIDNSTLSEIWREVDEGERAFLNYQNQNIEHVLISSKKPFKEEDYIPQKIEEKTLVVKQSKRKPGERNPKRDPVNIL